MTQKKSMSRGTAMFHIFICALIWSTGGLLARLTNMHPLTASGLRSILALPVAFFLNRPASLRFNKNVWLSAMWLAATGILFITAVNLTTVANAIVLQYCSPAFIVAANRMFYGERVRRADVLVTAACLGGMALFFLDELAPGHMLGNFIAILSGVTNAGIFVTMNRTTEDRNAIALASHIETALVCLPFYFLFPPPLTVQSISALLVLGIVQRGLSLAIFTGASKHCSAMDGIVISMAEPLLMPVWVMLVYGERPGQFALAGAAVILTAVFVWNFVKVRAAKMGVAA